MTLASEEIMARIKNLKERIPELREYEDLVMLYYVGWVCSLVGKECLQNSKNAETMT